MPTSLSATPNVASVLTFTQAPTSDPGLYPPFYPGPTAFPGRGNTLSGNAVVPTVLTVSAA